VIVGPYFEDVLIQLGINLILGLSLYFPLAAGQLSLGQGGFMAIGAYAASWLTVAQGWPWPLAFAVGLLPELQDVALDAAHGFFFGDAGIGDAIEAFFAESQLFVVGEIAILGHAAVVIVGDEIEDVFFEIGAGGANGVDLVLANHFGERDAEFGGAHGAGHGQKHFSALIEVAAIGFGGVHDDGGVEVAEVALDELMYAHGFRILCLQRAASTARTRYLAKTFSRAS